MIFIETPIFSRQLEDHRNDEEYRQLQMSLIEKPDLGKVIPGSGGLRKIRVAQKGQGKRGGYRLIYYWVTEKHQILMLFMYPKNKMEDISSEQLNKLRKAVEESLHGR